MALPHVKVEKKNQVLIALKEMNQNIQNLRSTVIFRKYLDPLLRCRRQPISHQIPEPF